MSRPPRQPGRTPKPVIVSVPFDLGPGVPCPTPDKLVREKTQQAAERHIENLVRSANNLEAYACPCGLYHLRNARKLARRSSRRNREEVLRRDLQALADEALRGLPPEERA